jgi:hypothetical protein
MIYLKRFFRRKIDSAKKFIVRLIHSKPFLGLVMLSIGISYTVAYYEFQPLLEEYRRAVDHKGMVIVNKAYADVLEPEQEEVVEEIPVTDCYGAAEKYSKQYGAPLTLMRKIIDAESGNNPNAENRVSTATGCFQWINGSWRHYGKELWGGDRFSKNIYSPADNTELAAYVLAKYGTGDWEASKGIWGRQ